MAIISIKSPKRIFDKHPDIPGLVKTVAKECGGLQFVRILLGSGMMQFKYQENQLKNFQVWIRFSYVIMRVCLMTKLDLVSCIVEYFPNVMIFPLRT